MPSTAKIIKPAAKLAPAKKVAAKKRAVVNKSVARKASVKRVLKPAAEPKGAINLRIDDETRDLIDRAADLSQQSRTDLMVRAARIEAQNILLDQTVFPLDDEAWDELQTVLANPPPANEALKAAFRAKPLWERE